MKNLIFIILLHISACYIYAQNIFPKCTIINPTPETILLNKIFYDIGNNNKIRKLFKDAVPINNPNQKIIQINISNITFEDSTLNQRRRLIKIDDEYSLFFIHIQDKGVYSIFQTLRPVFFSFINPDTLICGFRFNDIKYSCLIIFKYKKDKKGNWKLVKTKIMD